MKLDQRNTRIVRQLQNRILLLDGAMGTTIQDLYLLPQDFGGEQYAGCNEHLVLTRPEMIQKIHEDFLQAGADIVGTNTFGATPLVLADYHLQDKAWKINQQAVYIAQEACKKYSTPEQPRFVYGSIGPTTKSLSLTGGINFDELVSNYEVQIEAMVTAGVDYLVFETVMDTSNLKAGLVAMNNIFHKVGYQIPFAITVTIETMGTMLAGQNVEALYISIEHAEPLYIGLNCATGPAFMKDHIRTLATLSKFPTCIMPNAGLPDENGVYPETAEEFAKVIGQYVQEGWVNIIGGCCGTTTSHIKALRQVLDSGVSSRTLHPSWGSMVAGIESVMIDHQDGAYIVGERTNVIGSRKFKSLIEQEQFEEAAEIARKQVKAGAHIIDICLSNPDRDEVEDMKKFISITKNLVKVPFMIDSQVPVVVEEAFKLVQGKCILNSVNLENAGKSMNQLLPIVKKYGAAVVVGCIKEEMAVTEQEKLGIAEEAYHVLKQEYQIADEDIFFDPLVFPCGTGDSKYFGSGAATIEGISLINKRFPRCKTAIGVSNISFGLPQSGREVLNSVFLYHCMKAGLDLAIVNSEKLVRYSSISEEEKQLCDDLIWYNTSQGNDPVANFAAYYRTKKTVKEDIHLENLPVEKKLEINIVEGTKENLIQHLNEALTRWDALGVINTPLLDAMAVVGELFKNNELIVAEVLQSAEVMKTAVNYLEQFMEPNQSNVKGTILLATVKGDVHDIGKNLVEIILSNNGYKVINLGIKCPPQDLIDAYHTYKPDFIGLSGLLVKSAEQMVITVKDFKAAGIHVPVLVGGAALTENFTVKKIAVEYDYPVIYTRDAMSGLDILNNLTLDPIKRDKWLQEHNAKGEFIQQKSVIITQQPETEEAHERLIINHTAVQATPPHYNEVIFEKNLEDVWQYLNPIMLYNKHLGFKGNIEKLYTEGDAKAVKLIHKVNEVKQKIKDQKLIKAKGIYRFFKARAIDQTIKIYTQEESVLMEFTFPRQSGGQQLCLADYIDSQKMDSLCMFVVSCGEGIAELARNLMNDGEFFEAHTITALSIESAEALAELVHKEIRQRWGLVDSPNLTLQDIFKAKYPGVRVSFGYPACPRIEDQEKLWELLQPEKIGVTLSDNYMMYPDASVSAVVFHHPQARYFNINEEDLARFENIQQV